MMVKVCFLLTLVMLLLLPSAAVVLRSGDNVVIPEGQVIDDDLVASGGTVRMAGKVQGDLVVAGGTVEVVGPVSGSIVVAGGTVTISNSVGRSVYAAAGTLNLGPAVGRNLVATAGTLTVNPPTTVGRDLAASGGTVTVGGNIKRNAELNAGTLNVTETARIGGDLVTQSSQTTVAPGAVIGGQRITQQPPQQQQHRRSGWGWVLWFFGQLLMGLALLVTGLLFVKLAPRLTEQTEDMLRRHPWASLVTGLIIFLIAVPLFILLLITVIGIPLAFAWLAFYLLAIFISPIFVAILVGRWILRRPQGNIYLALLIGVALLILIRLVPILGFLVTLTALLFGLGALALAIQGRTSHPIYAATPA
ncbi:MAG: bactofilin family protein [Armatimonadota bacterium]